jgi:twitching motility two-component system response regulator PilH
VTTKDQDTDRVWGMRQGAKAYITKPFGEAELAEVIEQWLAGGPQQDAAGDSAPNGAGTA